MRIALRPDLVGFILLGVSLVLALSVMFSETLRAGWFVAAGLVALAVSSVAVTRSGSPALHQVETLRKAMAAQLGELRRSGGGDDSPLAPVVADAVRHVQNEIVPTLAQVDRRHDALSRQLYLYETGAMPVPDPRLLAELQRAHERQSQAIDACVRQVANAHATLILLVQQAHEGKIAEKARQWVLDLQDIYDGLVEALGESQNGAAVAAEERAPMHLLHLPPAEAEVSGGRDALATVEPATPQDGHPGGLTNRELEVLRHLATGQSSKEIAAELVVSVATVQRHIANIYTKIDARGRVDATAWAWRNGIVELKVS